MAIVSLKRDWFDGNGKYWEAKNNPHTMPDELLGTVPSDAKVEDDDAKEKKPKTAVPAKL